MAARLALVPKAPPSNAESEAALADFLAVYMRRDLRPEQREAMLRYKFTHPQAYLLAQGVGRPHDRRRRRLR